MIRLHRCSLVNYAINAVGGRVEKNPLDILFEASLLSLTPTYYLSADCRVLACFFILYLVAGFIWLCLLFCLSHQQNLVALAVIFGLLGFLFIVWLACFGSRLVKYSSLELYVDVLLQLVLEIF
jgi:hypothetical protein